MFHWGGSMSAMLRNCMASMCITVSCRPGDHIDVAPRCELPLYLHRKPTNASKWSLYCDAYSHAATCFSVPTPSSESSYDPHKLLTVYVSVHYRKNNVVSIKLVPVSIVTLWIKVVHLGPCSTTVHCFQQRLTTTTFIHSVTIIYSIFHYSSFNAHQHLSSLWGSYEPPDDGVGMLKHAGVFD
jgi:hypothetical protein